MSLDPDAIARAIAAHGPLTRVLVVGTAGSVPREVGASMLVWADGQAGTIGGGRLEWDAAALARAAKGPRVERIPLGPALGQCCGGAVTLSIEPLTAPPDPVRPVTGGPRTPAVDRAVARGRTALVDGWVVEPPSAPARALWVWGAGHVGRAILDVVAPLPGFALTWVDIAPERFPDAHRDAQIVAADPPRLMPRAPRHAEHLILTHDHAIDLALCHAALTHGFATCGLIGSRTKWVRFSARLRAIGHAQDRIDRIACPIGTPAFGKHPAAIAVGVAADLLSRDPSGTA
ncbi:MAG: xanthine dehydrogenase accessory protein XdhC [Paracoccaceae bacterium]